MQKISLTYVVTVLYLGEDEEFGHMAEEDKCVVVRGLPTEHISTFWKNVKKIRGCSRRPTDALEQLDRRLRIDWNAFCDEEEFLEAKKEIIETIGRLCPGAKISYHRVGSGLYYEDSEEDFDPSDRMILEGAFTDKEKDCLPLKQRADILGISYRHHG